MKIIIIALIILLILILFIKYNNKEGFEDKIIPGKTIWLLWLQGWDNAPWHINKIKESWQKYNTEWNIELVSENNLSNYINIKLPDNITHMAKSDIIRLNLLYEHGGVWADATMLCLMPLDLWVFDVIQPSGLWMYHGRDSCTGPASWFIISMKNNIIIKKWKESCDYYWKENTIPHDYFWMDYLFKKLLLEDTEFKNNWDKVPYICCEDEGQSHMLSNITLDDNENLKNIIKDKPPYVIKLSSNNVSNILNEEFKKTNMYYAIDIALNKNDSNFILHDVELITYNIFNKDKILVVPDCGNKNEIIEITNICNENNIQIIVFDKCNFCKHVSNNIYSRPLQNVGRDLGTYVYFIIKYYDYLPNEIYFLPSNINKHNRKQRFIEMLKDDTNIGNCITLKEQANFVLDEYEGIKQLPANIRPFKNWFEEYIGIWNDDSLGPCWNGVLHTNKNRIYKHDKNYYIKIYNELKKGNNIESGHYAERSMAVMF